MVRSMRPPRSPLSGGQLLLALVAIAIATVVVPPAAAWRLNQFRIDQTRERATQAAERLQKDSARLAAAPRRIDVACGPGRLPRVETPGLPAEWISRAVVAPELFGPGMPTDGWGRCFLMNIGEWPYGGRIGILSAGPNGIVDTPFGSATLAGDDIGAIVRLNRE